MVAKLPRKGSGGALEAASVAESYSTSLAMAWMKRLRMPFVKPVQLQAQKDLHLLLASMTNLLGTPIPHLGSGDNGAHSQSDPPINTKRL